MSSYFEIKNVSKGFGNRKILKDVSLSVERGKTVGLVGANGSGKSVLFKILCGFEKPDQGRVCVRGKQLGTKGRDFPDNVGVFINSPGFIGIYSIADRAMTFQQALENAPEKLTAATYGVMKTVMYYMNRINGNR